MQKASDSAATICKVLSRSLKSAERLEERITDLETENERLTTERGNALKVANNTMI